MGIIVTVKNGVTIVDTNNVFQTKHSTEYAGVTWIEKLSKYRAQIYVDRKTFYLGLFPTPEEANEVCLTAKAKLTDGTFEEWYAERKKKPKSNSFDKQ